MRKFKGLFLLFAVVIFIQVSLAIAIFLYIPDTTKRGTFGDMFGGINTLFSGLAFAGVIYAIILQSKELSLQREELKLTRGELKKSAQAQSEQAKALLESAVINATASQLSMFTTLIVNNRTLPDQPHRAMGDGMQRCHDQIEQMVKKAKKNMDDQT